MRERLTLAFVVLSILLLLGAGFVRSFILRDLIREQEGVHVQQQVVLVAKVVTARQQEGGAVDRGFLAGLVDDDGRLPGPPQQVRQNRTGEHRLHLVGHTRHRVRDPTQQLESHPGGRTPLVGQRLGADGQIGLPVIHVRDAAPHVTKAAAELAFEEFVPVDLDAGSQRIQRDVAERVVEEMAHHVGEQDDAADQPNLPRAGRAGQFGQS